VPVLRPHWLLDVERIDRAVYIAIASTDTPTLDRAMSRLARAADYSRLSLAASAALATFGGARGRHAAGLGLAAIGATSAVVNLAIKPLTRRHRPDLDTREVPEARRIPLPGSRSFPSGHAAAAFAFATGVGGVMPREGAALRALAALVAYSRVHTGVHYPGDVVAGSLLGSTLAQLVTHTVAAR
jgi:membrane-associated phospholipid phosphatase